jgi:hypothetical protein
MTLSKTRLAIVEAVKGKIRYLQQLKKKDVHTDLLIDQIVNKINSLITTYDLSEEKHLLEEVHNTLIQLKKYGLAQSFSIKHSLTMKEK